ncbi:MAG: hypothetical protein Q7J54_01865 [Candidatus Woesearchaeota archaeon]|nr:hypothetical protein [Candidatus Woesearchaeota archaeon]
MKIKKSGIAILVVSLFLVFTLSGCTSQNPGGNQTWAGGGGGRTGSSNGDASGGDSGSSGSQPPATGDSGGGSSGGDSGSGTSGGDSGGLPPAENPDGNGQQDMSAWKEYIQQIVDDPDATIKADLNALSLAQMSGLDTSDEFYNMIIGKIRAKIDNTLKRTDLCQNDLIPLIELAQLTGIDDLADEGIYRLGKVTAVDDLVTGAEKLYLTVPRDCSSVEFKYDSINTNGNYKTSMTASILGDLKEQTILDWVNSDARTYVWQRGKIEWTYSDVSSDSCLTITKSSIGRADLTKNDGSVEVYKDGTFSGQIISRSIQIEVSETVQPVDPEEDCSEYTPRSYTEIGSIGAYIQGSWADKYKITVNVKKETPQEEVDAGNSKESTITIANLHIPFPE